MHIRAALLAVPQALPVVIFMAAPCAGQGVRAPAGSVLIPKKTDSLFFLAVFLKKSVNTAFAALNAASSRQGGVDLILGDELPDRRNIRHLRRKGRAGQRQIIKIFPNSSQPVVVEPHQAPVLPVGRPKGGVFLRKGLPERRDRQLSGQPCGFLREPAFRIFRKAWQIPGFFGFIAEIVIQIPELFRKLGALIAFCFSKLHIGGKLPVLQKLPDAPGGVLPGNDLGGPVMPGGFPVRKMDTVLTVPCGDTAGFCHQAVSAVIKGFQIVCDLSNRFPLPVGVAAQPQHMVNIRLGKRKSRGRFHTLCFVDILDLFRFGEEQI